MELCIKSLIRRFDRPQWPFTPVIIVILFLACERKQDRQTSPEYQPPKVVEANGYTIDTKKLLPPVIVRASPPSVRIVGKPEVVHLPVNVFPAKSSSIPVHIPKPVLKSNTHYEPPKIVVAIDSQYPAKPPEVITLETQDVSKSKTGMFSAIKARNGLHSDEISSLMTDKKGNLWIGEWWGGGICRYDGRSLRNYSIMQGLSSDVVNCIFEDDKQNIWIGTYDNGINKFDGKYFTHYSVKEGLQGNIIYCITQDHSGNMWFGTNNGLTKFDGRRFTHYTTSQGLPSNRILSLLIDSKGQLWVGSNGGVTRFDGHFFLNYTYHLDFEASTEVLKLIEDSNGNIWFATDVGLYKYNGAIFEHFTTQGGLASNVIISILQEKNGDIWIGTQGGGVDRYDGKSFTHYDPEQGLPNKRVTSIAEDKWGNIWLGTTSGVAKYEGKMFTHVVPTRQDEIETLFADSKGNVWMASGSGSDSSLNKYDGRNMFRYTINNGLSSIAFNQLYEDRHGNMWFSTWNGVDKFDGKYITHYSKENGLIDSVIFCVTEDKKGNYWFATNRGLSKFDGKYFTNYSKAQGLCSETIFLVMEDHLGNIWLGTNDNGVCKFDGKTFTHYSTANGLSHPMVVGMTEDSNNNIWICTAFGLNKFDGKKFTWFTKQQGLTNNITKTVLEDHNGNIWIGTINGLNRLKKDTELSNDSPDHSFFKNYTTTDGFSGGGTYENSMSIDKNGAIWIGSNDRLTLYHPEGDVPDTISPVLELTGISLFGEKVDWQKMWKHNDINFSGLSRWYNQPENLQLNYDNNFVTFEFIGITTNKPKEVRYRYFLEGLDEAWTSTIQPVAVYSKLPHGKYTFRVQSANGEGRWSDELSYSLVIFPPWWQTTIAYIMYVIVLAMAIWLFAAYRSRRLKAENLLLEQKVISRTNELEQSLAERYKLSEQIISQQALINERLRISRELHDDIGSTLGSISIYSEVAKQRAEKNENPFMILSKIGMASRELIEKMSDIVWSLNLNSESFDHMQRRMLDFAAIMLAPRNIRYDFNIDENARSAQLSSAQAKNIFLIYKEALHNMVKYSGCSSAVICFHFKENQLSMSIQDDGKGFLPFPEGEIPDDKYLGGNGIRNMYARSLEMQAKLSIDSKIDGGTRIVLIVPM